MTPERAAELAKEAIDKYVSGYDQLSNIQQAILQACAEERADVLKNEFICARCQLRQDSTREIKHEF
jgi:hypothetical protein